MSTAGSEHALDAVPASQRELAREALHSVLGGDETVALQPVSGGASGALVYRVDSPGAAALLLRLETARDAFRNPHRSYPCLQAAADAGIAPHVHLADPEGGVVVMDFVEQRPITEHPGGAVGILAELGRLVARLQTTPASPALTDDFAMLLAAMLEAVEGAGLFSAGVLEPARVGLGQIADVYPWQVDAQVSSHNDINPYNVLFDGRRLWLIDWELAFRNDRLADIAGVVNNIADPEGRPDLDPSLVSSVLTAWLGRTATPGEWSRLVLMRQLNRLFYACLMLTSALRPRDPEQALVALTPAEFRDAITTGRLGLGSPDLLHEMGKMQLVGFVDRFATTEVTAALVDVAG